MKKTLEKLINNKKIISISLFLYLALIFFISSRPSVSLNLEFHYEDKIKHFIAYFVMSILILRYLIHVKKFTDVSKAIKYTIILGSIYGISDEIHQGFVGYFDTHIFSSIRDASFADWVADVLGVISGTYIYYKTKLKLES